MGRKILCIIILLIASESVFGASGFGGGKGLFRLKDASNEGANILSVSSRFIFRRIRFENEGFYHGPLLLPEFSYSPTKFLEFTASLAGTFTYRVLPYRDYHYDWHGEVFGTKLTLLERPIAKFGVMGFANVARANKVYLDSLIIPGPGYRALFTFDFSDAVLTLPSLTINAGETFGKDRMFFLGAGTEIASKMLSGIIEFSAEQKWGDFFFGDNTKLAITPGIKVRLPFDLSLEGGVEFGLNRTTPDYVAVLGLNYLSPLIPKRKTAFGTITGKVTDRATGLPIQATVKVSKACETMTFTDPNTGIFTIQNVPIGVAVVQVENETYHPQAMPLTIKENEITTVQFELKKIQASGTIAGVVTDLTNNQPIEASITIKGKVTKDINTDPVTGFYQIKDVPVGVYSLYTKKDGYATAYAALEVKENETTLKDFQIIQTGTRFVLQGIKFDFDKATIRPESYPILDNTARLLKENPGIIVEIQGYTDNSGSFNYNQKLSLKRAQAVVNYLVEKHNIEPSRLFAQGYGEANPIFPNDTKAGRIMNRRVEFFVVGEKK